MCMCICDIFDMRLATLIATFNSVRTDGCPIIAIVHKKRKKRDNGNKKSIFQLCFSMQMWCIQHRAITSGICMQVARGRSQARQNFRGESVDWSRLRDQREGIAVMYCENLLRWSRRLCEESEETSSGDTDEAELDGERASGAVAELLVARVRRTALAGGLGAGGRGGHGAGARGRGARGGDGAVVLGEGSGDGCCGGRGGSGGDLSVGCEGGGLDGGGSLGDGALDGGLDSLGDRAGGGLSTGGSALGGTGDGGGGDD